jgi:hypothetical protein
MKTTKALTNIAFAGLAALSLGLSFSGIAEAKPVLVQHGSHGAYTLVNKDKAPAKPQKMTGMSQSDKPQEQANMDENREQSMETPSPRIITRGPNGAAFLVY